MSFIWSEALFLLFLALLNLLLIHCADLVLMKKTASLRSLQRVRFSMALCLYHALEAQTPMGCLVKLDSSRALLIG